MLVVPPVGPFPQEIPTTSHYMPHHSIRRISLSRIINLYNYMAIEMVPVCVSFQWSAELADQEKLFVQQAKLVQVWDRTLADSGDKVLHHF